MKTACVRVQGHVQMIVVVAIGAWPVACTINTHACVYVATIVSLARRGPTSMDFACTASCTDTPAHACCLDFYNDATVWSLRHRHISHVYRATKLFVLCRLHGALQ
jgi:hypothetical protein